MSKKKTARLTLLASCRHSFCDAVRMPGGGQTPAYFCGLRRRRVCGLYRDPQCHCFDRYKGPEAIAS